MIPPKTFNFGTYSSDTNACVGAFVANDDFSEYYYASQSYTHLITDRPLGSWRRLPGNRIRGVRRRK